MAESRHPAVVVEKWRTSNQGDRVGYARVRFPSGMIIGECAVHQARNGRCWAMPPSRAVIVGNKLSYLPNGKISYITLIDFTDKPTRDRWSNAVVAAVREHAPEAFASVE